MKTWFSNLLRWYKSGAFWHEIFHYMRDEEVSSEEVSSEYIECYRKSDIVGIGTRPDGVKYYLLVGGRKVNV
jgi:hypothetical protein